MSYVETLNSVLKPISNDGPLVLDLFAGCGGLALGFEAQGFRTLGFEKEADGCATYRHNLTGDCHKVILSRQTEYPRAEIVIGGPPCQPFSVGGYQAGIDDARNGVPAFVSAVEQVRPELWMFENVRGMLYRNKWYLDQVIEQTSRMGYKIEVELLNAANYGVPQKRERVFVVGHRGRFSFPPPQGKWLTAGDALGELAVSVPDDAKFLTPNMDKYVANYEQVSFCTRPRDLHLNEPSRTVTCRNLAAPTGDMMRIRLQDGRRRRLTVREAARIQSFPDWFDFKGNETSAFNQIGNAVPPMLSYHIAACVRVYLNSEFRLSEHALVEATKPHQPSLFDPTP